MTKRIPITEAKRVAEAHGLKQVLLIGYDGERVHVVTYGATKADCAAAAKAQDFWAGKIREFSFEGLHPANEFCVTGPGTCNAQDCRTVGRCLGH